MTSKIAVKFVAGLIVALTLAACGSASAEPLAEAGQIMTVRGEVQSINLDPMAVDGPGEVVLETEKHGTVLVYVAACFGPCVPEANDHLFEMEPGGRWLATGEVQEDGSLLIYVEGEHSLTPLD